MVGIFKGSTPITPNLGGAQLSAVYVGATKIWPTKYYECAYGQMAHRGNGNGGTTYWASNPGIVSTGEGNAVSRIDWGISWGRWGLLSNTMMSGDSVNRLISFPAAVYNDDTSCLLTQYAGNTISGNQANGVKALVPLENDDGLNDVYARFDINGIFQWSSDGVPWANAVRIPTGGFIVTAPYPILNDFAIATSHWTSSAHTAQVETIDSAAGKLTVMMWSNSTQKSFCPFTVQVFK